MVLAQVLSIVPLFPNMNINCVGLHGDASMQWKPILLILKMKSRVNTYIGSPQALKNPLMAFCFQIINNLSPQ